MPVIEIKSLPQNVDIDIQATIKGIATAVAAVLEIPSRFVFCTWQQLEPGYYVEGDSAHTTQPDLTHPPIVHVTLFEGRTPQCIEKVLTTIAEQLQIGLKRDAMNAFISYHEAKSGQVFAGDQVLHRSSNETHSV